MNTTLSDEDVQAINKILVQILDLAPDQIKSEAAIEADLGADSLDMVEIGMAVEERFSIAMPDQSFEKVVTVQDLYDTVGRLTNSRLANVVRPG